MPLEEATNLASTWVEDADLSDIDPKIMELEANILAKQWKKWHVPEIGEMTEARLDGVHRFMLCQLNSASSEEVRERKLRELGHLLTSMTSNVFF